MKYHCNANNVGIQLLNKNVDKVKFLLQHYTGTSKKCEYHEKGQYFLSLISESETHILYRVITHIVKYFKLLFLEMLMIMAYR